MKTLIFVLLTVVSVNSYCQKTESTILTNQRVLGKNLVGGTDITGTEFIFPDRIQETYLDTTSGFLTVQLRGTGKNGKWLDNKGNILVYDLYSKDLKWSKKINYQTSSVQQFSNTVILTVANKSYCLDINTGEELWEVRNDIYFVDPISNTGIGYKYRVGDQLSDKLEGIDLKTGDVLWKRELSREYAWNNVFYLNDTTLLAVAAGLHTIHLKNGSGWDYNTVTGDKDYSVTNTANALGAVAGVLTGTFVISTGYNLVRDLVSNVLADSTDLYFASKEKLARVDKNTGEVIWSFPFPQNLPSKSVIFANDSLIYMINKGSAFMGYRQLSYGKPFLAAFNKNSGKQRFFSIIDVKDDPILGFQQVDDVFYLVFKNRVAKYSSKNGNLIQDKEFPEDEFGELKYFTGSHVYSQDDQGEFSNLSDTTRYVYTGNGKTLVIDDQLNLITTIEKTLWLHSLNFEGYKFITNDTTSFVLDSVDRKIAEIEVGSNAFILGNTLYSRKEASFTAINLEKFVEGPLEKK
ncbi:PQQ-binding-like beta-propeller repeat protein [uncultured Sunxiuqinia sp.]|uniref:outer membrane protein assembly factor BamB family protein n=1 Tax=uncultured Sunxiuqinia sp. TaxID=1573825 RepID=UPI0030DBB348